MQAPRNRLFQFALSWASFFLLLSFPAQAGYSFEPEYYGPPIIEGILLGLFALFCIVAGWSVWGKESLKFIYGPLAVGMVIAILLFSDKKNFYYFKSLILLPIGALLIGWIACLFGCFVYWGFMSLVRRETIPQREPLDKPLNERLAAPQEGANGHLSPINPALPPRDYSIFDAGAICENRPVCNDDGLFIHNCTFLGVEVMVDRDELDNLFNYRIQLDNTHVRIKYDIFSAYFFDYARCPETPHDVELDDPETSAYTQWYVEPYFFKLHDATLAAACPSPEFAETWMNKHTRVGTYSGPYDPENTLRDNTYFLSHRLAVARKLRKPSMSHVEYTACVTAEMQRIKTTRTTDYVKRRVSGSRLHTIAQIQLMHRLNVFKRNATVRLKHTRASATVESSHPYEVRDISSADIALQQRPPLTIHKDLMRKLNSKRN
jgi:hypothetical protein